MLITISSCMWEVIMDLPCLFSSIYFEVGTRCSTGPLKKSGSLISFSGSIYVSLKQLLELDPDLSYFFQHSYFCVRFCFSDVFMLIILLKMY